MTTASNFLPPRGWTADQLLDSVRPRGEDWRNVYIVSGLERGLAFYGQQVRALRTIAALAEAAGGELAGQRLAVVGAGAAGCTAALAACYAGADEVVLFVRGHRPLHTHALATRWLHPHIDRWPSASSRQSWAGLPLLDWRTDRARAVVAQLRAQLHHERLRIRSIADDDRKGEVRDVQGHGDRVAVVLAAGGTESFDAAIVALDTDGGPLRDPSSRCADRPIYWDQGWLDWLRGECVMVSGSGDEELVDLARVCMNGFRYETVVDMLDPSMETTQMTELLALAGRAETSLHHGHALIDYELKARVQQLCEGRTNQVYFNCPDGEHLSAPAAPLHR
ncbi:MAG: FAD-dependent oxidoreductase, partial [Myxococcota bacterium]